MSRHRKARLADKARFALASDCATCGKKSYLTRREAKRAAAQALGRGVKLTRAYRCGEYWHLTSQDAATVTAHRERSQG
jgi:hypothetical protein